MADTLSLPPQVSPPALALSPALPHQIGGGTVWAFPVVPGEDGVLLGPGADEAGEALGVDLLAAAEAARATGATGQVTVVPVASDDVDLVLLVGVGASTTTDLRRAGAALARSVKDRDSVVTTIPAIAPAGGLGAFVVGAMLGSFGFHWRSSGPREQPVARIVLAGIPDSGAHEDADDELARAIALGGAGWRARTLATVPSNLKTPDWLAQQATEIAGAGLDVTVWDEERLTAEGFGGILAVGGGSVHPPRLVRLDYTPRDADRRTPTVVLVGKGITFDTGGLDIKPPEGMLTMKRDMSGGAAVLATMAALGDVGCPVRVVGLVPAAENAVSGSSMRPGDVITHWGGRTSEVNNTDAEGRLVLADAMAYAVSELSPAVLVDVATLTGAMKVALGQWTGGFFANDEGVAARLAAAAEASGEPLWRMPLVRDYEEKVLGKVADGDNAAGGPGSITAALYLQHFAGDVPWGHVDFASAAEAPTDRHEWTTGPTGFGARLLLSWLGSDDPLQGIAPKGTKR